MDHNKEEKDSPRTMYSEDLKRKVQRAVRLLMKLDVSAMERIRHHFETKKWQLTLSEFIHVVQVNLHHSSAAFHQLHGTSSMVGSAVGAGGAGMTATPVYGQMAGSATDPTLAVAASTMSGIESYFTGIGWQNHHSHAAQQRSTASPAIDKRRLMMDAASSPAGVTTVGASHGPAAAPFSLTINLAAPQSHANPNGTTITLNSPAAGSASSPVTTYSSAQYLASMTPTTRAVLLAPTPANANASATANTSGGATTTTTGAAASSGVVLPAIGKPAANATNAATAGAAVPEQRFFPPSHTVQQQPATTPGGSRQSVVAAQLAAAMQTVDRSASPSTPRTSLYHRLRLGDPNAVNGDTGLSPRRIESEDDETTPRRNMTPRTGAEPGGAVSVPAISLHPQTVQKPFSLRPMPDTPPDYSAEIDEHNRSVNAQNGDDDSDSEDEAHFTAAEDNLLSAAAADLRNGMEKLSARGGPDAMRAGGPAAVSQVRRGSIGMEHFVAPIVTVRPSHKDKKKKLRSRRKKVKAELEAARAIQQAKGHKASAAVMSAGAGMKKIALASVAASASATAAANAGGTASVPPHGAKLARTGSKYISALDVEVMNAEDREQIRALCEMFFEIDVNGDGVMTYEEFTTHLAELAHHYFDDYYSNPTPQYVVESDATSTTNDDSLMFDSDDPNNRLYRRRNSLTELNDFMMSNGANNDPSTHLQPFTLKGRHGAGHHQTASMDKRDTTNEPTLHAFLQKYSQRATGHNSPRRGDAGAGAGANGAAGGRVINVHPISFVKFFPEIDRLVVVEKGARKFKLYTQALKHEKTIHSPHGPITSVEFIARYRLLVACTEENFICFFDARDFYVGGGVGTAHTHTAGGMAADGTLLEPEESDDETDGADDKPANAAGGGGSDGKSSAAGGGTERVRASGRFKFGRSKSTIAKAAGGTSAIGTAALAAADRKSSDQMNMTLQMAWEQKEATIALCWTGRTLFASDTTGRLYGYKLEHSNPFYTMTGHRDIIMHILHIPAHKLIVTSSLDTTVRFWSVVGGRSKAVLHGHERSVIVSAYAEKGNLVITGGLDSYVLVWELVTQLTRAATVAFGATAPHTPPLFTLNLSSPDSHTVGIEVVPHLNEVIVCENRGCFRVYELNQLTCTQTFSLPKVTSVGLLGFTSCGGGSGTGADTMVAADDKLHRFRKTKPLRPDVAHETPIQFAAFNPVMLSFVTISGTDIKIWNALTGMLERHYKNITHEDGGLITSACLDDRFRRIFLGLHTGKIKCFSYSSGAFMKELDSHRSEVSAIRFVPGMGVATTSAVTGSMTQTASVVTAGWDRSVCVHSDSIGSKNTTRFKTTAHTKDATQLVVSAALRLVASGGSDGYVFFYDWGMVGGALARIELDSPPSCMFFVGRYPLLFVATQSGAFSCYYVKDILYRIFTIKNKSWNGSMSNSLAPTPGIRSRAPSRPHSPRHPPAGSAAATLLDSPRPDDEPDEPLLPPSTAPQSTSGSAPPPAQPPAEEVAPPPVPVHVSATSTTAHALAAALTTLGPQQTSVQTIADAPHAPTPDGSARGAPADGSEAVAKMNLHVFVSPVGGTAAAAPAGLVAATPLNSATPIGRGELIVNTAIEQNASKRTTAASTAHSTQKHSHSSSLMLPVGAATIPGSNVLVPPTPGYIPPGAYIPPSPVGSSLIPPTPSVATAGQIALSVSTQFVPPTPAAALATPHTGSPLGPGAAVRFGGSITVPPSPVPPTPMVGSASPAAAAAANAVPPTPASSAAAIAAAAARQARQARTFSPINGCCFDDRTRTLYTCDDHGVIKAWPLRQLLSHFAPVAIDTNESAITTSSKVVYQSSPPASVLTLQQVMGHSWEPTFCFTAHQESVLGIELIHDANRSTLHPPVHPPSASVSGSASPVVPSTPALPSSAASGGAGPILLSYCYDGTAHLWSAPTGTRIGSLQQGHNRYQTDRAAALGPNSPAALTAAAAMQNYLNSPFSGTAPPPQSNYTATSHIWGFHYDIDVHKRAERALVLKALRAAELAKESAARLARSKAAAAAAALAAANAPHHPPTFMTATSFFPVSGGVSGGVEGGFGSVNPPPPLGSIAEAPTPGPVPVPTTPTAAATGATPVIITSAQLKTSPIVAVDPRKERPVILTDKQRKAARTAQLEAREKHKIELTRREQLKHQKAMQQKKKSPLPAAASTAAGGPAAGDNQKTAEPAPAAAPAAPLNPNQQLSQLLLDESAAAAHRARLVAKAAEQKERELRIQGLTLHERLNREKERPVFEFEYEHPGAETAHVLLVGHRGLKLNSGQKSAAMSLQRALYTAERANEVVVNSSPDKQAGAGGAGAGGSPAKANRLNHPVQVHRRTGSNGLPSISGAAAIGVSSPIVSILLSPEERELARLPSKQAQEFDSLFAERDRALAEAKREAEAEEKARIRQLKIKPKSNKHAKKSSAVGAGASGGSSAALPKLSSSASTPSLAAPTAAASTLSASPSAASLRKIRF